MSIVSIIIPTNCRPGLLSRAVESAKAACADAEVIVVDDASTDLTASVCEKLDGIKYVRLARNQGVAGARNAGVLASSGEFIVFHDDDDIRFPGSLVRQLEQLQENPEAGLVYGPIVNGDEDCLPLDSIEPVDRPAGDIFWALLARPFIPCLSVVFRKSCLLRIGMLDARAAGFDDWDLWVRIAELYSVVASQEPVGIWRSSSPRSGQGSSSRAVHMGGLVEHQIKLLRLPRAMAAPASMREEARRKLIDWTSDLLIWDAATWLPEGFKDHARHDLLTALRMHPSRALRPWTLSLLLRTFLPGSPVRGGGHDKNGDG